jgi:hypothetical protein
MCIDQVSWLTFILLTAPSRYALGVTVAILRLSSRSQSRGGGRYALPSLNRCPVKAQMPVEKRLALSFGGNKPRKE